MKFSEKLNINGVARQPIRQMAYGYARRREALFWRARKIISRSEPG